MIVGMGIDVCSIDRMGRALERHGDRFFDRICTTDERADLTRGINNPNRAAKDFATGAAGRFAAKEAFAKALDGARGVGWHEVQVRRSASGRPVLVLSGNALSAVGVVSANAWHVSITHDAGVAMAVVILERIP